MAECDLREIGRRISLKRKRAGYTQEQLAEEMDVSVQMISNLERGIKSIRIENLIRLCRILGVSTDYILMGKSSNSEIEKISSDIKRLDPVNREMVEMIIDFCLENR